MYDPTKPMSPTNSPESMIGDVATTPTGAKVNTTTGALISAPPSTSTITSDLLAPTPAPVVSPTPVTSPISVATLPEATPSVTAPISDVEGLISQLEGRDVKAEATAQTAEQQRGLNEINKQIRLHQARSLEAEQKALRMGETTGFARGEAERTRDSNAVRALELSALAQAAQGDLELASTLATDSINEKYKKVEADLRKKRNDIIANYDNLSPSDKKRADATLLRLNAEDTFVKEKKANEAELKNTGQDAAAKGAPLSLVQKAMATGDIIKASSMLAPYLNPKIVGGAVVPDFDGYLDETELKKIDASPQGKKVKSLGDLKQKLQGYRDLVAKYGTETPLGGQKPALDAAFADLKIAYKEAANLGALTGPDVALLEEAIKPATFGGLLAPITRAGTVFFRGGQGGILQGIDQSLDIVQKTGKKNLDQLFTRDPRYKGSFYVQELARPFQSELDNRALEQGFDIEAARAEGYTDEEIEAFLNQ